MIRIRIHGLLKVLLGLCLLFSVSAAMAEEASVADRTPREVVDHVVWKNVPIRVILPVGEERRLDFPATVKIEWPRTVEEKTRRLQIRENGSVYWTAAAPFESQRVNVMTTTGETYLLNVEARENASARTLVILDDRFPVQEAKATQKRKRKTASLDAVDLVRFAAQMLYGPRRVVKALPGMVQIPVDTQDLPLYKGGALRTSPIAQWKAGALYVTAVRVTSDSLESVELDPRLLRGDWISATPQHSWVAESGGVGDTTAWYLVSDRPFEEVAP